MAPVRPGRVLPPGLAGGPASHARAHAELEQPGKCRGGRQPDRQMLHDPEPGFGLHRPHQAQHRGRRHLGIRVQGQHKLELAGVMIQEVHDVAGLEAGILRPAAVADALRRGIGGTEGGDGPRLRPGRRAGRRVGQDAQGKGAAMARPVQPVQQPAHRRQHARHVLVADGQRDGGARRRTRRTAARPPPETSRARDRARTPAGRSRSARWRRRSRSTARCPGSSPASPPSRRSSRRASARAASGPSDPRRRSTRSARTDSGGGKCGEGMQVPTWRRTPLGRNMAARAAGS